MHVTAGVRPRYHLGRPRDYARGPLPDVRRIAKTACMEARARGWFMVATVPRLESWSQVKTLTQPTTHDLPNKVRNSRHAEPEHGQ